uniref:Uncharacterized protein n=1 Tax=Alexandrium monilatum TaxID=311494 RepID=A0A7S4PSJ3_9DINO
MDAELDVEPWAFMDVDRGRGVGVAVDLDMGVDEASAGGIVQIALEHGIKVAKWFEGLGQNGCAYLNRPTGARFLEPQCGWLFVDYATSAALEEVFRCDTSMTDRLARMKTELPRGPGCPAKTVFDYREHLASLQVFM